MLFAILYCRKEENECHLSVQELVESVGVELEALQESLQSLEAGGFIRVKEACEITDATSFLSCSVLVEKLTPGKPNVPRP